MACRKIVFKHDARVDIEDMVTELFVELSRGCGEIEVQGIDKGINRMVEALSLLKEKLGNALKIVRVETSSTRSGASQWRRLLKIVIRVQAP